MMNDWDDTSWESVASRQEDLLVDFSMEAIQDEIKRGQILKKSWLNNPSGCACRVYSKAEKTMLSISVREYLSKLESEKVITAFHREWALMSAQAYAARMKWPEIPMALMVSVVFLIQVLTKSPSSALSIDTNIADSDEQVTLS